MLDSDPQVQARHPSGGPQVTKRFTGVGRVDGSTSISLGVKHAGADNMNDRRATALSLNRGKAKRKNK